MSTIQVIAKYKNTPVIITISEQDAHLICKPHIIKQKGNKLRVAVKVNGKYQYLHRTILDVLDSKIIVDHIDGNPLNNCRANLRLATPSENSFNQMLRSNNTSGLKGVWKRNDKRKKCWVAEVKFNKVRYRLGSFYTQEEAANAYNKKAYELSVFARGNK